MQFITTVDDASVYGITEACLAYNASLPATVDDGGGTQIPNPAICVDNYAYLDFVLTTTIQSWCEQYAYTLIPLPAPSIVPVTTVEVAPYP